MIILTVCYCTAHDNAHVHLPDMMDSQYGLPIIVGEPDLATTRAALAAESEEGEGAPNAARVNLAIPGPEGKTP